ncbi:MAG: imidazole glycerol phosphate synthase subunit HisF [Methanomassiliicoccaceae archaeon]|nr:imidazole glycerol phosphate synthase subunit HisF [Methanomassiliicoccaceae archaeon]
MAPRKIVPCLDIKDGKVVKGVNFVGLRDIGPPPQLAEGYCAQGADEVAFLDLAASTEGRQTTLALVAETSKRVTVPFTVGGGIRSADDVGEVLAAGADKVSINTAAVRDPGIVSESAERFGKERIVVAIDAKQVGGRWEVMTHGGARPAGKEAVAWAGEVEDLGAGEILLTSVDTDGVKGGYDIPLNRDVADAVGIPVTASGGCGRLEDFYEVFSQTGVAAALAASAFHYGLFTIGEVKGYLKDMGVPVTWPS